MYIYATIAPLQWNINAEQVNLVYSLHLRDMSGAAI